MDFAAVTVLCVGDVMLDRYMHGDVNRISPEAPIPVMRLTQSKEMLGGAGNVANNIAALRGNAVLVSLVGRDDRGETVRRLISQTPGITAALVETDSRPTLCKTRFIAGGQQVVRADEESLLAIQPAEEEALIGMVEAHIGSVHAVLLSDYGKAVLSPRVLASAIAAARARRIPIFTDPKGDDFTRYRGVTCITPNLKELAQASKLPVTTEAEVVTAAQRVMAAAEADAILVTRSELGMMLVPAEGRTVSLPARAREVFDVSGAGDTVIATLALGHASGMSLVEAMSAANAAAGVVVSKSGTATVTVAEVLHELEEQDLAAGVDMPGLVHEIRAGTLVERWKHLGLKVGFTNGCFDILHPGHVSLLKAARAECDRLIVAVNTDASVRRLKGPTRPVNDLQSRAQVLAALRYVDCVIGFDEETPINLIRKILPDVLIKGSDYTIEKVVGADVVQAAGGRVFLASFVPGQSTTQIISRAQSDTSPADASRADTSPAHTSAADSIPA